LRRWWGVLAAGILLALVSLGLTAPLLAPLPPNRIDLKQALQGPSATHWLGTDQLGRDLASRLLYGTRSTLSIALPVVLAVAALGVSVGLAAGYYGRWLDAGISMLLNAQFALPNLVLSLAILALLGTGRLSLIIALIAANWAGFARMVRGPVLQLRETGYVEAARATGASDGRILLRHVLPNVIGPILVLASLELGSITLSVAALSYLGLGDRAPAAEWGAMLNDGRPYFRSQPWLMALPGLCICLVALAANLLGDLLRDLLDPRSR
jgi:peptide/nickel transport system permease protein